VKTLWNVIAVVVVLDVLAALGFVGYLYSSGRLNRERLERVAAMLRPTVEEEQQQTQQQAQQAQAAQEAQRKQQHLAMVAQGPLPTQDQLSRQQEEYEKQMMTVQRLRSEVGALQRQLELAQQRLTKERQEIAAEREALQQAVVEANARQGDVDFQHAVALYEQLKPAQTKRMFQELLAKGQKKQVVEYLAAMQVRKAAGVLKEFKEAEETAVAAELVQALRERGVLLPGEERGQS